MLRHLDTSPRSSAPLEEMDITIDLEENYKANTEVALGKTMVTSLAAPVAVNVETKPETDPYAYLERNEFSSEKFKIEIKNLPKFYGITELRKLLNEKLSLATNKIKLPRRNSPFVFVCFRNDEDRLTAVNTITNYKWKGKVLTAVNAKPAADPLVKKRKDDSENAAPNKRGKVDDRPQEERLKHNTAPLCDVPYQEQLVMKQEKIRQLLSKLGSNIIHSNASLRKWVEKQKGLYNGLPCKMLDIRYAKQCEGYRNKCEFTIGMDVETGLRTIGFRIGRYTTGETGVGPVDKLIHIPIEMKIAVKVFQTFVRASDLEVFNPENQTGHFKQVTMRFVSEQLMLVVGINPQTLDSERLAQFKQDLIEFFFEGPGKEANITSLYYQALVKKTTHSDVMVAEHLHGATHIFETLLGLKFRISPEAFFQINTLAAEILYNSVIEVAQPSDKTTIIDICCGTGTIGLCVAKKCSKVLGVETVTQAIIDAKENALANNIENCEFFTGKAEDILGSVIFRAQTEEVIAIVDPPRAGLHLKAIMQLRKSEKIKKLVYISCNAAAAMQNFKDLARPCSKTLQGDPFVPVKAVAVDMFPQTHHCELVILFERWEKLKMEPVVNIATEEVQ